MAWSWPAYEIHCVRDPACYHFLSAVRQEQVFKMGRNLRYTAHGISFLNRASDLPVERSRRFQEDRH